MTLQSGNKSHTKLFPLHWSCLARTLPQRHAPPSPLQHHRRRFQLRLQLRLRLRGQHSTLSCAQIQNPNPNPFSINDAPNLGPRPSDRRLAAVFRAAPSPCRFFLAAHLGHCRPLLLMIRLGRHFVGSWHVLHGFVALFIPIFLFIFFLFWLFPLVVFELSALLVWHPLTHTHTHRHTHRRTHTHTYGQYC